MLRPSTKIVRSLALLGVIAVVMLWLLGGRTVTLTVELDTQAKPARIFREITDPERMAMWMSDVTQIQPRNELAPGVGTQARIVTENASGTRGIIESEIVEFDSDRMVKLRLEAPRYDATSTFIIERKGRAYRLQQRVQAHFRGIYRLITPFIKSTLQERLAADFLKLKQLLEEPAAEMTSVSS